MDAGTTPARTAKKPTPPKKPAAPKKGPAKSPLQAALDAGPARWLELVLWHFRHRNQDLAVVITAKDLEGLEASLDYTKQKAEVSAHLKPGRLFVSMVEAGTRIVDPATQEVTSAGNAIRPCENNPQDQALAEKARALDATRQRARELSRELLQAEAQGVFSQETVREAARALTTLADA